jgi:hemerythrin-like domain-containing protein
MQATDILMQEHRVIEGVLDTLQTATQMMDSNTLVRPGFFIEAADFIRGFADGCHHHKEEGVLFKMMVSNGMAEDSGPVGMMLSEHEMGRKFTRAMRSAAENWDHGDESARQEVLENARGYVALLRQHILKEDKILFPMADQVIPEVEHQAVFDGFEKVEHEETGEGIHEKYLALAGKLSEELIKTV